MNFLKRLFGCKEEELKNEIESLNLKIDVLNNQNNKFVYPKSYGRLNFKEVYNILNKVAPIIDVSNDYYELTTKDEAIIFTESTNVMKKKWIENVWDCDMFSRSLWLFFNENLMQFAFGYARSQTHRFNIMIDKDKKLWVCEPQNNTWFLYEDIKNNPKYSINWVAI